MADITPEQALEIIVKELNKLPNVMHCQPCCDDGKCGCMCHLRDEARETIKNIKNLLKAAKPWT